MTCQQAAHTLHERIGHLPWAISVSSGTWFTDPVIYLHATSIRQAVRWLDGLDSQHNWEGFPVVVRKGEPLGLAAQERGR